jgi:hypothetical protein
MVQFERFGPGSKMSGTTRHALNGHNSINNNDISRSNNINLFLSMFADCSVPRRREWDHKADVGRRRPPWSSARSQSVVTTMAIEILIMIFFSNLKAQTCREVCWLIVFCLSAGTGTPWDDGGRHGCCNLC